MPKYDANWYLNYNNTMKNVYTDYIQDKGFTVGECQRSAEDREYPKTIHGRTFETREQYLAELHDFLNGM